MMNINYDLIDLEDEGLFCVREVPTDRIIMASGTRDTAKKYIRTLNKGAGFNGWTPNFFVQNDIVV